MAHASFFSISTASHAAPSKDHVRAKSYNPVICESQCLFAVSQHLATFEKLPVLDEKGPIQIAMNVGEPVEIKVQVPSSGLSPSPAGVLAFSVVHIVLAATTDMNGSKVLVQVRRKFFLKPAKRGCICGHKEPVHQCSIAL